ncbi:PaaI family thioesterase [Ferrimonas aestuarii]|uniref:PaaI family thioesterase n=1 Tax=Ferrimonas aestuarii TaxID=2569539 RepID=A0A4U1BQT9_9GAMM|nr:PaaI family thioesterase [Ferrimonas aestuarii]TKB56702.1 PaaI family thioesterase [Ferrimonas aestuarii]
MDNHHRRLEAMYQGAPINGFYPTQMQVSDGEAELTLEAIADYHHAAGAMHGSVYFKLLDDAAYFAVSSLEPEVFVLTTSFTTYLTRPVSEGTLTAIGKVVNQNNSQWIAESVIYDIKGREIGRGNGIFVRSKNRLLDVPAYRGN